MGSWEIRFQNRKPFLFPTRVDFKIYTLIQSVEQTVTGGETSSRTNTSQTQMRSVSSSGCLEKTKILSQKPQNKEKTILEPKSVEKLGQRPKKKNRDHSKTEMSYSFAHVRLRFLRGSVTSSPVYSAFNLLSIIRPKNSTMSVGLIPVYGFRPSPEIP